MTGNSFPEIRDKADREGRPFEEVFEEEATKYFEELMFDM